MHGTPCQRYSTLGSAASLLDATLSTRAREAINAMTMAFTMTSSAVLVRPFAPNCTTARRPSGSGALPAILKTVCTRWDHTSQISRTLIRGSLVAPVHHKSTGEDVDIVVIMHGRPWQAPDWKSFAGTHCLSSIVVSPRMSARDVHEHPSSSVVGCGCEACLWPIANIGEQRNPFA